MESGANPYICSLVFIVLLIVNGILNAFYSALDNLNESIIEDLVEDGNVRAKKVNFYLDNESYFQSSVHLISALCYIVTGVYCVPTFSAFILAKNETVFGTYSYLIIIIIVSVGTFLVMLSVSYASIMIGGVKEEKAALKLCKTSDVLIKCVVPIRFMAKVLSGLLVRVFGIDPNKNLDEVSEDEIISMVNEGHEQGIIESSEAEMIHNIFEFTNKEAQDIMTHRKNMISLSGESTFTEAMDFMLENNISRYPVYMEDTDNIIGIVHIRDCMERMKDKSLITKRLCDIEGLIREVSFIPETRNISDLFHSMQEEKNHMAIVVDEYGQTSGLVTMEDILEEIVGNIFDEYDEEELSITSVDDGTYMINGMTPLEEVAELLDVELPVDDYDTINGYLISLIDRIPTEEEQIQVEAEGYLFEVISVENKIIKTVHVTKLEKAVEDEPDNKE